LGSTIIEYVILGDFYKNVKFYHEAITAYERAVHLNPKSSQAYAGLAAAYLGLNNRDAAIDEYKVLKKLDSKLAEKLFKELYP
jgi:tetratricopeptide (TPR) repeat protein